MLKFETRDCNLDIYQLTNAKKDKVNSEGICEFDVCEVWIESNIKPLAEVVFIFEKSLNCTQADKVIDKKIIQFNGQELELL